MVAKPRIELGTQGFSVLCSTDRAISPNHQKDMNMQISFFGSMDKDVGKEAV